MCPLSREDSSFFLMLLMVGGGTTWNISFILNKIPNIQYIMHVALSYLFDIPNWVLEDSGILSK